MYNIHIPKLRSDRTSTQPIRRPIPNDLLERQKKRLQQFIAHLQSQNAKETDQNDDKQQSYGYTTMKDAKSKGLLQTKPFRLKDCEDWSSFYTSSERYERKKNAHSFSLKYGDANVAYRSIASQSEYVPKGHFEHRSRDKSREIQQQQSKNDPKRLRVKSLQIQQERNGSALNNKALQSRMERVKSDSFDQDDLVSVGTEHDNTFVSRAMTNDSVTSLGLNGAQSSKQEITRKNQNTTEKGKKEKQYWKQLIRLRQLTQEKEQAKRIDKILSRHGIVRKIMRNEENQRQRDNIYTVAFD